VEQGEGDENDDEDEEEPMFVVGLNPPTPAPRKADASNRMPLNHPKFHHSNVTRKYYKKLSCPKNSSDTTQERPPNERVPTFVLGGTQKAGTSALYYLLKATNRVVSSTRFETHFFDNAVRRLPPNTTGASATNETLCQMAHEYRAEFPDDIPPDTVTFEKVRSFALLLLAKALGRTRFETCLFASMDDGMCVGAGSYHFSLYYDRSLHTCADPASRPFSNEWRRGRRLSLSCATLLTGPIVRGRWSTIRPPTKNILVFARWSTRKCPNCAHCSCLWPRRGAISWRAI
jgi:hypothetical protein